MAIGGGATILIILTDVDAKQVWAFKGQCRTQGGLPRERNIQIHSK